MIELIAILGTGLAALSLHVEKYRLTNHGDNPWSVEGFANVMRLAHHMERARKMVDGQINSVFRSEQVNQKVGGVKASRHLRGLAADIKPNNVDVEEAVRILFEASVRGDLGPVRKVVREPKIVHLSWFAQGEPQTKIVIRSWGFKT